MELVQLLSAAGVGGVIGSLLTTLIQTWFARKQVRDTRVFEEKKEAYIGLLDAYRTVALANTEEARVQFAYWRIRCDLIGSLSALTAIEALASSNPNSTERNDAEAMLKKEIRSDLGIV